MIKSVKIGTRDHKKFISIKSGPLQPGIQFPVIQDDSVGWKRSFQEFYFEKIILMLGFGILWKKLFVKN